MLNVIIANKSKIKTKEHKELWEVMDMLIALMVVMVSWM